MLDTQVLPADHSPTSHAIDIAALQAQLADALTTAANATADAKAARAELQAQRSAANANKTVQASAHVPHDGAGPKPLMAPGSAMRLQQTAPLLVLPFPALMELGHLPRSTACTATIGGKACGATHKGLLREVGADWDLKQNPIVMISHSWVEPKPGRPDNSANRKFQVVMEGVRKLSQRHRLVERDTFLFIDWCCIPQDIKLEEKQAYIQSLPAFVAQMSFVLVPLDSKLLLDDEYRLDQDGCPVPMNWQHYSERGWCRLEMLAGRVLASMGTGVRIYRHDISSKNEALVEVLIAACLCSQCDNVCALRARWCTCLRCAVDRDRMQSPRPSHPAIPTWFIQLATDVALYAAVLMPTGATTPAWDQQPPADCQGLLLHLLPD